MSSSRPNVIFILTDDQGYGDLSRHGNPVIETPTLDRIHDESVRFTDFHVCPVCTPTRGELLTGRDALRNGATFVCMGRSLLRADLPTLANLFADNGYRTGHFGKWHLGDNYPYRPQDRGFHESVWHPGWGITSAPDYFDNDYFDDHYRHRDEIEQFTGYCTDVWFREATAWIDRCRSASDPFFAYIATNAPHGPLWVPDEYRQPYLGKVERAQASYYGMINCIEQNIARLDRYLHEKGLAENTILVFMSDNGTTVGQDVFNAGMRGRKASIYEGGHRVPFFIRWPDGGVGAANARDVGAMTRSPDLAPTLVDLCGLSTPDGLGFDGLSLAGIIRDPAERLPERMSVVQYGHLNDVREDCWGGKYIASVLWDSWRLVNGAELYDVASDPGQANNIAEHHPEVVAAMKDHYEAWWATVSDTFTSYQPITIGSSAENPVKLSSPDWAYVYADNPTHIRGGIEASGTWHILVEKPGLYEFSLARWPEESGLAIADPAPMLQGVDGTLPEGVAFPVATAWLRTGHTEQRSAVKPDAGAVSFRTVMEAGRSEIRSWWFDEAGRPLAGAYYLTVERIQG